MSILRLLHSADPVTPLSTRDVWRIDRAGALSRLTRRTETLDPPGPGEVRVAVDAVGLNFADVFACLGLYSATPKGSFIPGLEFAGVVAARGDGADPRFAVGDAVFGLTRFGGYVSAINVPNTPASISELSALRRSLKLNFRSADVSLSPFWNVTSSRNSKSMVWGSGRDQDLASSGRNVPLTSS